MSGTQDQNALAQNPRDDQAFFRNRIPVKFNHESVANHIISLLGNTIVMNPGKSFIVGVDDDGTVLAWMEA